MFMLVITDYAKTYTSTIYQSLRAAVHMRTITVMQIKLVVVVVAEKNDFTVQYSLSSSFT